MNLFAAIADPGKMAESMLQTKLPVDNGEKECQQIPRAGETS